MIYELLVFISYYLSAHTVWFTARKFCAEILIISFNWQFSLAKPRAADKWSVWLLTSEWEQVIRHTPLDSVPVQSCITWALQMHSNCKHTPLYSVWCTICDITQIDFSLISDSRCRSSAGGITTKQTQTPQALWRSLTKRIREIESCSIIWRKHRSTCKHEAERDGW